MSVTAFPSSNTHGTSSTPIHRTWIVAGIVGTLAFAIYVASSAPGLTWAHQGADGGELLAAAVVNGVPHPPGYPLYIPLLQFWLALTDWIAPTADLAWRGAIFSSLSAALSTVLTVITAGALTRDWQQGWLWAGLAGSCVCHLTIVLGTGRYYGGVCPPWSARGVARLGGVGARPTSVVCFAGHCAGRRPSSYLCVAAAGRVLSALDSESQQEAAGRTLDGWQRCIGHSVLSSHTPGGRQWSAAGQLGLRRQ